MSIFFSSFMIFVYYLKFLLILCVILLFKLENYYFTFRIHNNVYTFIFGIHIFEEYSVYTMSAQGIHIFQKYSIYTMSCTFR